MPDDYEEKIKAEVEADFRLLDSALITENPGIAEMLQVFGDYELLFAQANAYIASLDPEPAFFTSDRSDV